MNYYERHIGDYLKDTAHLSLLEHGVYTRLMDVYYTRECAIPALDVARLVGARSKDEKEALQAVLSEFFQLTDGAHAQDRCDREIARFKDKQAKAKRSADARWSKPETQTDGNADASPDAMRTHSEGNAPRARPQTPDTRHQSKEEGESSQREKPPAARKRAPTLARPDDVAEKVWNDWLQLRKAKRAPVTGTVLDGARAEAGKAGLTLDAFLRVWCNRGSQGLLADWLKPNERAPQRQNGHEAEPEWRREQRERNEAALGPYAAKRRTTTVDMEAPDGPAFLVG